MNGVWINIFDLIWFWFTRTGTGTYRGVGLEKEKNKQFPSLVACARVAIKKNLQTIWKQPASGFYTLSSPQKNLPFSP